MVKFFWKAYVWAAFILIICGIPGDDLDKFNIIVIPYLDKMVHLVLYYIFATFLFSGFTRYYASHHLKSRTFIYGTAIALSYGILIELLQLYVFSHRSFEILDIVGNFTDIVAALASYPAIHRLTEGKI